MAVLVNSANLTRLILLFSGTALILIGFYGIMEDFIHNWRIEEYSSLAALLSGAAILFSDNSCIRYYSWMIRVISVVDCSGIIILALLRARLKTFIIISWKRSQGIVAGAEILADYVHACIREDITHEECKKKILEARKMLVLVKQ